MAVIDFWLMDAHRRDTIMVSSTSSGVTDGQDGGKGASRPPLQDKLKNWLPFSWHFDIWYSFSFQ